MSASEVRGMRRRVRDRTRILLLATGALAVTSSGVHAQATDRGGADRADTILRALHRYEGHWRSDVKTDREGRTFHFTYDGTWLDPGRTIARIVIRKVGPGAAETVVFEGFKGREPTGEGVYYHAASPSGRGARGEVRLEGQSLVTSYDGWTAAGDVVRIRDVFTPVREDGTFTSRTFLRSEPGAEWREVGRDEWTRSPPPGDTAQDPTGGAARQPSGAGPFPPAPV